MRNFLKFKKRKNVIYLFLIFNQFIFSANALNLEKEVLNNQNNKISRQNNNEIDISNVNKNNNYKKGLIKDAENLEKFVEDTFGPNDFENVIDQDNQIPLKPFKKKLKQNEINKDLKTQRKLENKENKDINPKKKKTINARKLFSKLCNQISEKLGFNK